MSSLAGALDDYRHGPSDDIEMSAVPHHSKGDESEEDGGDDQDEEMDDLFGNDNDGEGQRHVGAATASPTASGPDSERLPSPERERRQALEYEEEDIPPEIAVEVKEAEVTFPNLPVPRSSDGDNWVVRMPNFVKVDTKPFHPDTYVGPEQEEEELQGDTVREKSMTIKLKVENTLRWRWAKDEYSQDKKESNSRIIRWSDGTLSLRLGKEYFDITQSIDSSAGVSRSTLGGVPSNSQNYQSQSQSQSQSQVNSSAAAAANPTKSEGLTYLVAQHKRSQVLQSEAVVTGYMALRPTSMQSETHRMLVRAVGQKHNKVARLRIVAEPTIDPEREKMELIKQSARKSKKKADDEGGVGGAGRKRRNYRRATDHDVMWSDDDEEPGGMYAGSEEDDEDAMGLSSSPRKGKRKSGEEKEGEDYQADDFVVPDESDEDGENAGRGKKRARAASSEDDLERMEANLERQAAEKKNRGGDAKRSTKKKDDDEDTDDGGAAMDVESEEEEEQQKVRRVASKRAIALDDDDDDDE